MKGSRALRVLLVGLAVWYHKVALFEAFYPITIISHAPYVKASVTSIILPVSIIHDPQMLINTPWKV